MKIEHCPPIGTFAAHTISTFCRVSAAKVKPAPFFRNSHAGRVGPPSGLQTQTVMISLESAGYQNKFAMTFEIRLVQTAGVIAEFGCVAGTME